MKLIRCCKLALCLLSAFVVAACSTTKVIPQGQSRLKANRIIVENSKDYLSSDLQPYLKQKPNTSLFLVGTLFSISITGAMEKVRGGTNLCRNWARLL